MNTAFLSSVALATIVATGVAQTQPRVTLDPIDVDALTGTNGNLGVQYDRVSGNILVSHRYQNGTAAAPHGVTVIDPQGNFVNAWSQSPLGTDTSAWGLRDMCSDGFGNFASGFEGGVVFFDINGNPVRTFNGQTVAPFVSTGAIGTGTHRALAFDPAGNNGAGSMFLGDFGADIEEVSLSGNLLATFANPSGTPDQWSAYGLAFMPPFVAGNAEGSIWINSAPNAGQLREFAIDRANATLAPTGRVIERASPGSAQGGLDFVLGSLNGRGGSNCGNWELLALDQSTPDIVYAVGDQWPGYTGPRMLTGVNGGPLSAGGNQVNLYTDTSWEYDVDAPAGTAYAVFFNFGPLAQRAAGPIFNYNELYYFRLLTGFTNPAGAAYDFSSAAGNVVSLPASPVVRTVAPIQMHAQAVVLDPNVPVGQCGLTLPLGMTDVVSTDIVFPPRYVIRAQGNNSYNAVTTSGFFSVESFSNNPADAIVSLTFDWVNSSNAAQNDMEFDCDQTAMADAFWNGNASGTGTCAGTYRNGSDVAAGLDYAAPQINLVNAACAQTGENAGVEAANQVNTSPDYRTLTWRFTGGQFRNGVKFEFDIDTDLGAGTAGDEMAGMVVTIVNAQGQTLTGELQALTLPANTSELVLQ